MNVKNLLVVAFEATLPDTILAVSVRKTGYRSVLFKVDDYMHGVTRSLNSRVAAEKEFDKTTINTVQTMLCEQ